MGGFDVVSLIVCVDVEVTADMVQTFFSDTDNPKSVTLRWKPPRSGNVLEYLVLFAFFFTF